jgi:hypothetical protein
MIRGYGKGHHRLLMTLERFLTLYCGKYVDYDGVYGAQCVDLFRQYCKDVLGIPHTGACSSSGGAKDLYNDYAKMPLEKKYFVKLAKSATPSYGYVAVWNSTPANSFGHVAIVICRLSNSSLLVFEQNGINQDGAKFAERKTKNLLGYLKFKGV